MRIAGAVVVASILGVASSGFADDAVNLLGEGQFDAGTEGWSPAGKPTQGVVYGWSSDAGREGGGLTIRASAPGQRGPWLWAKWVDVRRAEPLLRVSGWIRARTTGTLAAICVQARDAANHQVGFATTPQDKPLPDAEWTRVSTVLAVPSRTARLVVMAFIAGDGEASFDDVRVERTDEKPASRPEARPGLSMTRGEFELHVSAGGVAPRLLVPVPMSYREQVPLTYEMTTTPSGALVEARVYEDKPGNFVVATSLRPMKKGETVVLAWRSLVVCGERSFADLPERAPIPAKWPDDVAPWLRATQCVQSADPRFVAIGKELRDGTDDVREILRRVEVRARQIHAAEAGDATTLDALTALDKRGSCTSCANLAAAMLRAAGVPARVVCGSPCWSGPLQTHYIVEAAVPGYGWYPIESTLLVFPWQPFNQIEVCIVPPEYEDRSAARASVMGGAPYLSLDESVDADARWWRVGVVDRDKNCGHVAEMLRPLPTDHAAADWTAALDVARARWKAWLASAKLDDKGRLATALQPDVVKATTAAELAKELAR